MLLSMLVFLFYAIYPRIIHHRHLPLYEEDDRLFSSYVDTHGQFPGARIKIQMDARSDMFFLFQIYRNSLNESLSPTTKLDLYDMKAAFPHLLSASLLLNDTRMPRYELSYKVQSSVSACKSGVFVDVFSTPDHQDGATVLNLAKMAYNSYMSLNDTTEDTYHIDDPYGLENDFGWSDNGLRGYIYTNADQSIVVIAVKGTSMALFAKNSTTIVRDKYNVDFTWTPICGCYDASNVCNETCIAEFSAQTDSYYEIAKVIVASVRKNFPKASLWLTGHSMGGALASLLAVRQKGTTAFSFSSPGERLFAQRLGLVPYLSPPSEEQAGHSLIEDYIASLPIYHYYHSADPIPYGACSGKLSSCYYGGYAMETECHLGKSCIYDRAEEKFDISKHKLRYFIENILQGNPVPPRCRPQLRCFDCPLWNLTR